MRSTIIFLLVIKLGGLLSNNLLINHLEVMNSQHLTFKVSWENSWKLDNIKAPYNHDGVWLFFKYYDGISWKHLQVSSSTDQHELENGLKIENTGDQVGILIVPSEVGGGDMSNKTITIRLAETISDSVQKISAFGIEMAAINKEAYYLGDGVSNKTFIRGSDSRPYHVTSEDVILVGKEDGMLSDAGTYAPEENIPLFYPKGYELFYCMKYEISQEQYVDFLNTLSYTQQAVRTELPPNSPLHTNVMTNASNTFRNGIVIANPGFNNDFPATYACDADITNNYNHETDGQNRACNYLNWDDVSAYLDWAGLSPMTELEYEKISRGTSMPIEKKYAWGNTHIVDANELSNDGTAEEQYVNNNLGDSGVANYRTKNYGDAIQGPYRVGFAGTDSSNRLKIGASYYGVLEMSGNLWELCVTVNEEGLSFKGGNGDGILSNNGDANEITWPTAAGAGHRGGAWNSGIDFGGFRDLTVSDREYAGLTPALRRNTTGGRGVKRIKK